MLKIKKLFSFFSNSEKTKLILFFFMMFLSSIFELIGFSLIIPIINIGLDNNLSNLNFFNNFSNFFKINPESQLLFFILLFVSVQILKVLFLIWYLWFENNYIYNFKQSLSAKLFKKYLFGKYSIILKESSSKKIRNITYSVDLVTAFLFNFLKISLETILLISIGFFLLFFNFKLSVYIFLLILIFVLLYNLSLRNRLTNYGKLRQIFVKKRLQFVQESFENLKYLKVSKKEKFFFEKFKEKNIGISNLSIVSEFLKNLPKPLLELFAIFLLLFFLYFSIEINETPTVGVFQNLAIFIAAFLKLMPSLNRILSGFQSLKNTYPEVENLSEEIKNSDIDKEALNINKFNFDEKIEITIENFKHEKNRGFEFKNLNMVISQGDNIGIVGESGSGKSTLLDIISGLQTPNIGNVKVDGKSVFLNINGWQNLIGYVPQKVGLLEDNLRNNILFGNQKTINSDEKIIDLINKTNLTKFFKSLDKGLDSMILEKGQNISGGEIQRIGICRALYNNPKLLIFDEFTSSLDEQTERKLIDEINLFYNKTMIFVTHKKGTLKNCNKIFELKDGKIKQI